MELWLLRNGGFSQSNDTVTFERGIHHGERAKRLRIENFSDRRFIISRTCGDLRKYFFVEKAGKCSLNIIRYRLTQLSMIKANFSHSTDIEIKRIEE